MSDMKDTVTYPLSAIMGENEDRIEQLERELAEAVEKERERCAKVCEERGSFNSMYAHHILTSAAAAIRKGEKESLTVAKRKPVPEFELIEKWEGE
jgi:hypothetical protein